MAEVWVAVVKSHFLQVFNCTTEAWAERVQLSVPIQTDDTSVVAMLPDGSLFVSGGNAVSDAWGAAYHVTLAGQASRLSNLLSPRGHHGVIAFQGSIFVFGGRYYGELLNDVEKLDLAAITSQEPISWQRLPYMPTERAFFQPCVSASLIFLCGGGSNLVESFDPASQVYTQLPLVLPESTRNHLAVWKDGALVIISQTSIVRWTDAAEVRKHEVWLDVWGNFGAVNAGEMVYTVKADAVLKMDLAGLQQARFQSP